MTVAADPIARAAAFAALGHGAPVTRGAADALARAVTDDPDPRARAAALGALVRRGDAHAADRWAAAADDADARVRRRAAELTPRLPCPDDRTRSALAVLLDDDDVTVVEAAAWAIGELADADPAPVRALEGVATEHRDALAREAAVAALGARAAGLDAILAACRDVPTVRRRAVLALAPFEGPAVDAALARAAADRDWQVRQAADDLLGAASTSPVELRPRRPASPDGA